MNLKLKEIRLLNIKIYKNKELIYQGKAEDAPNELKEQTYQKIYFEGVDVIIEL